MTDLSSVFSLAAEIIVGCKRAGLKIATAESCTGGLVAAALTEVAGSSAVFERGFVTYSYEAKDDLLGVPMEVITPVGAVSETVARLMAEGALAHSPADLAVAVTGIAGPSGGSPDKPVGLVHFATARRGSATRHTRRIFNVEGRSAIRLAAVREALALLRERIVS